MVTKWTRKTSTRANWKQWKLLWSEILSGFALPVQLWNARNYLKTSKEKCVYPSQLLQKLHQQHSPNFCQEVLRGHSSSAKDVKWSRSRTVDILKPHYANLTVGAVGQSCYPVNQTVWGFFYNIVGNLILCLVCVVSAISFLAPGDLHISSAFYSLRFGNDPPWASHVGIWLDSPSLLM